MMNGRLGVLHVLGRREQVGTGRNKRHQIVLESGRNGLRTDWLALYGLSDTYIGGLLISGLSRQDVSL